MYFESRAMAGAQLASELMDYRYKNTVVLALSESGVAVGYQIAIILHAALRRLLMQNIYISDESVNYATVLPGGVVMVNPELSEAEQTYYYGEYASQLEQDIREAIGRIDREISAEEISPEVLHGYNVILVDDGIDDPTKIAAAQAWLKPIKVARMILACPVVSVPALDRAHILCDEIHVLAVAPNYISTDHHYEVDDKPDPIQAQTMIDMSINNWK